MVGVVQADGAVQSFSPSRKKKESKKNAFGARWPFWKPNEKPTGQTGLDERAHESHVEPFAR